MWSTSFVWSTYFRFSFPLNCCTAFTPLNQGLFYGLTSHLWGKMLSAIETGISCAEYELGPFNLTLPFSKEERQFQYPWARFAPLSRVWSTLSVSSGEERGLISRTAAGNRAYIVHIHTWDTWYTSTSPTFTRKSSWNLKDVEIVGAEISLINSVLVRIKSRVLTVSKMRRSLACELFPGVACLR